MVEKILGMNFDEILKGYTYDREEDKYICEFCGCEFQKGEIFKIDDRYFDAGKMIKLHIQNEHPDMLQLLMNYDKKYTGLTETQKELLSMFSRGMSDSEISKKLGNAPATVRHQRFMFKEKAKQAKLYLAIYELVFGSSNRSIVKIQASDELINAHKGAKMVDDRYFITQAEEEKILESMFSSLNPLKLKTFSSKEKKKIVILKKIAQQFEKNRRYSEKELNAILKDIFDDYATIRRYLIEYGYMERTTDCKEYWLK